jgi:hypothetical protein
VKNVSSPLFYVDPITFRVTRIEGPNIWENHTRKFLDELKQIVKKQIEGKTVIERLKILNDEMVKLLDSDECEWSKIPSDTRFPGFFSSMSDHALATSAVGVALAVELWNKKVDLASEYGGEEVAELLKSREGVIEVVRTLCLLHDAGKPSFDHEEKTKSAVVELLSQIGFGSLASELACIASKHHYGEKAKSKPEKKLEYIVAFADKVAVQDRSIMMKHIKKLGLPLEWLRKLGAEDIEKIDALVNFIKFLNEGNEIIDSSSDIFKESSDLIPLDYGKEEARDRKLIEAPKILGVDDLRLALLLLEGHGIQGYIRKSEKSRYLIGSSSLVEAASHFVKDEIVKLLSSESLIYSASGSILSLVPFSELSKITSEAANRFNVMTEGGIGLKGPNGDYSGFNLFEARYGPRFTWLSKEKIPVNEIERRCFGEHFSVATNTLTPLTSLTQFQEKLKIAEICNICFEEKSYPQEDKRIIDLKNSLPEEERKEIRTGKNCLRAYEHSLKLRRMERVLVINITPNVKVQLEATTGDEEVRSTAFFEFLHFLRKTLEEQLGRDELLLKKLKDRGISLIGFTQVSTWDHLGRQSITATEGKKPKGETFDLSFIKGDGDNFGTIKSSMSNITLYRKVSKIFRDAIQISITRAIAKILLQQINLYTEKSGEKSPVLELPFDILYFGGDDFLIVLDAGWTFIFLKEFRDSLQELLGRRISSQKYEKKLEENLSIISLGVSMGVATVTNRMPIYATLEAVDALLKRAKDKGKKAQEAKDGEETFGAEICVAFMRFTDLPSEESVETNYKAGKDLDETKIMYIAWPRLGSEIFETAPNGKRGLINLAKELLDCGLNSNNIASAVGIKTSSVDDAVLRVEYKATRMQKTRKERKGYETLAENLVISEDIKAERGIRHVLKFQHLDLADILKVVFNKKELLP